MTFEPGVPDEAHAALAADILEKVKAVAAIAATRASDLDQDGGYPSDDIDLLSSQDLLAAPLPLRLGGIGLGSDPDMAALTRAVLSEMGAGSLPLGRLYEGHLNAVALATRYGAQSVQEALATEVKAGRISAVWMAGEALTLRPIGPRRFRLHGQKVLCSGAGRVRRPLIAAELPDGAGSVMILANLPAGAAADCSRWTPAGMRATATGTIDFTDLDVDQDDIIGQPGDYLRSPYFQGGAWRVLAVQLGGVLALTAHYRDQLAAGAYADHPLQLARFGEAVIAAETARRWVAEACCRAEGPFDDPQAVDAYVNLARNALEQAALTVIGAAQKAIGLNAFLRPNPIERIIRDLSTYLRQPALDPSLVAAAAFHLGRSAMPLQV